MITEREEYLRILSTLEGTQRQRYKQLMFGAMYGQRIPQELNEFSNPCAEISLEKYVGCILPYPEITEINYNLLLLL